MINPDSLPAQRGITCSDLTVGYDRHPALHHLNLQVPAGTLLAVVGPNGAGKSTWLKVLAGLLRPMTGTVSGLSAPGQPGPRVAYLPQHDQADRSFPVTVLEMVTMGLWHAFGAWGRLRPEHHDRARQALAAVGLQGFEARPIDALSGGQWQRAQFARLMLQDATTVLLDEPFAAIDRRTTADLLAILHRWHGEGRTVVAVLHDLDLVRAHFPTTLVLARRCVAYGPTAGALSDAHWAEALALHEPFDEDAPLCAPEPLSTAAPLAPAQA